MKMTYCFVPSLLAVALLLTGPFVFETMGQELEVMSFEDDDEIIARYEKSLEESLRIKDYEGALGMVTRMLEVQPDSHIYFRLGTVQFLVRDYSAALQSFQKARDIAYSDVEGDWVIQLELAVGITYDALGQNVEARQFLEKALSMYSDAEGREYGYVDGEDDESDDDVWWEKFLLQALLMKIYPESLASK